MSRIETIINPAGTHFTTLWPMPIVGTFCERGFLALGANMQTHLYSHILQQYRPEVVMLIFSSKERPPEDLLVLGMPGGGLTLPTTIHPMANAWCTSYWERRAVLDRSQFELLAAAEEVRIPMGLDAVLLPADHLRALHDLAGRLQPASDFANVIPDVRTFEGDMVKGENYVAEIRRSPAGWWPIEARIPAHHALRIEWVNLADYGELADAKSGTRRIIFTVFEREVSPMGRGRWNTEVRCRILRLL